MPAALTYPGVYVEEISSGVHTISGVATSIAAFLGWAVKGPTDSAVRVTSWPDYERKFGGLLHGAYLGYAVYQFFANGGQIAYVGRLRGAGAVAAQMTIGGLTIDASSEGEWANDYGVRITPLAGDATRFTLQVVWVDPQGKKDDLVLESFSNLSVKPSDSRFVDAVVKEASTLVRVTAAANAADPTATSKPTPAFRDGTPGVNGTELKPGTLDFHTAIGATAATKIPLLDHVDLFNLLCVPGETDATFLADLQTYCRKRRAFLIADCSPDATVDSLGAGPPSGLTGDDAINAAFYFPWIDAADPLQQGRINPFPPSGFVAGVYARTDSNRGVWKAPAGVEATPVGGVVGPDKPMTDIENGVLNIQAVNCIRNFPVYGTVVWGARTLRGNNEVGSEWKYIPVRRTALFIEESLYRGTKWAVFEPNDEPLWAQIRLNVGAFMHDLFRKGAFQGDTPRKAYFVKCDNETTTQNDINNGVVNVLVGFAPLKPAEFVVLQIQQIAGDIQT